MYSQPAVLDQAASLRRLAMQRRDNTVRPSPRMITVTSGKGGVGKSTLALNLAIKFSQLGRRILLVDADANLGNLDVMLGISPKHRLSNVLRGELDLEDALVGPFPRLKILAGNSGEADYPLNDIAEQNRFIDELTGLGEQFDAILIDTASGLNMEIVNFAIHSNEVVVVTNVEPTSVMDAYAVMKIIWAGNPEIPLSFVMNAVRIPRDADEAAEKLQRALGHFLNLKAGYRGIIPYDEYVSRAVVEQQPVVTAYPRSAASLSIEAFAQSWLFPAVSSNEPRRSVPV